jgi:hypothetical protein
MSQRLQNRKAMAAAAFLTNRWLPIFRLARGWPRRLSRFETQLLILVSFVALLFVSSISAKAANSITQSHVYSREELEKVFATPVFQATLQEIDQKLAALPQWKTQFIGDTELAFSWGADWRGLAEELRSQAEFRDLMDAIRAMTPGQIMPERYTPMRLKLAKSAAENKPLAPGDSLLTVDQLTSSLLSTPYAKRLVALNSALPGFIGWLYEGAFQTRWILTDEVPREPFCLNNQPYRLEQKIIACQKIDGVRFERAWYQAMEKNLPQRASVIIHELVRYKVMALASYTTLNQQEQDALTARITVALLDETISPENFYRTLEKANLLVDPVNLLGLRIYEVAYSMNMKAFLLENVIKFNSRCENLPQNLDRYFQPLIDRVYEYIGYCRRYARPEEAPEFCETKTLAFHLKDHRERCTRPGQ